MMSLQSTSSSSRLRSCWAMGPKIMWASTHPYREWMIIVQSFNKDAIVSTDETPRGPEGDNSNQGGDDMPMTQEGASRQSGLHRAPAGPVLSRNNTLQWNPPSGFRCPYR